MDTDEMLKLVAEESRRTHYKEEYQAGVSLYEALGTAVAQYCGWSAEPICEAFIGALEDANFHDLADYVQEWLDNLIKKCSA